MSGDEYTVSTNTSNELYLYDLPATSSTTWHITWWDGNKWQQTTVDPLEEMKEQFNALKDKFFEDYPKRQELFDMRAMREERLAALMQRNEIL